MRITTDELGVVAFVLPGAPNRTFELSEWPDGSFSLEPVAASDDAAVLAAARARAALVLESTPRGVGESERRTA